MGSAGLVSSEQKANDLDTEGFIDLEFDELLMAAVGGGSIGPPAADEAGSQAEEPRSASKKQFATPRSARSNIQQAKESMPLRSAQQPGSASKKIANATELPLPDE